MRRARPALESRSGGPLTQAFDMLEPRVLLSALPSAASGASSASSASALCGVGSIVTATQPAVVAPLLPGGGGAGSGGIEGRVFDDIDGDGTRDDGEPALAGVSVFLDDDGDGALDLQTVAVGAADVPVGLIDLQTVTSALNVQGLSGTIRDLNVTVDIDHGLVAEVDAYLISPWGLRVELFTDVGSSGRSFAGTTLDDEAPTRIVDRRAPFAGSYQPEGSLADFDGQSPAGVWMLELGDDNAGTIGAGRLNAWSLTFTLATERVAVTDTDGGYVFDNLPAGDYRVVQVVPQGRVQTLPDPAVDVARIVALGDGQVVSGVDLARRRIVGDLAGVKFSDFGADGRRDPGDRGLPGWTVFLDPNGDGALSTQQVTVASADVPMAIPDKDADVVLGVPVTSELAVTALTGAILDVDVTLNITHPSTRDLRATLISPGGAIIELFNMAGAIQPDQQNFVNTTLDDEADVAIRPRGTEPADPLLQRAPFTGRFRPRDALSALDGQDPGGTWLLELIDESEGGAGVLEGWSLTFTLADEPATVTDAGGAYAFTDLPAGDYDVVEVQRAGFTQTWPGGDGTHHVALGEGQLLSGLDFANVGDPSVIEGVKFDDLDGDGRRDAGEPGVNGLTIELVDRATGVVVASDVTHTVLVEQDITGDGVPEQVPTPGSYRFERVPLGDYDVREVLPAGAIATTPVLAFGQPRLTNDAVDDDASPNFVLAADLDGDGFDDLVVVNRAIDDVLVRFNQGDGTFGAATSVAVGDGPNAAAAGDFDGDGDLDLAVTNGNAGTVSLLRNRGDGTFDPAADFAAGALPNSAAAGDVDNDGDVDLAVVNVLANTLSVLLNAGDGTFAAPRVSPAGPLPRSLQLGDLDGDGDLDAAMASFDGPLVTLLLNAGDGTFTAGPTVDPTVDANDDFEPSARFVSLADFNDDGLIDLAAATQQSNVNGAFASVFVMLNDGDLTFARPRGLVVFQEGDLFLTAADLTGDGVADLAVSNFDDDTVSVLHNRGDGTFTAPIAAVVGRGPARMAAGDFDGDGRADLAALNVGDESVSVLLSRAGVHRVALVTPTVVSDLDFGNFTLLTIEGRKFLDRDGDGARDYNEFGLDGFVITLLGRRQRVVAQTTTASVDRNGDGRIDPLRESGWYAFDGVGPGVFIVQEEPAADFVQTYPQASAFAPPLAFDTARVPVAVAAADFDNDGDLDIAAAAQADDQVSVLINKGNNRFRTAVNYDVGADPVAVVAADLNGDGLPDLASANATAGTVSVLVNQGDGTFGPAAALAVGGSPAGIVAADLDGDGDKDLAVTDFAGDAVLVLINQGAAVFAPPIAFAAGDGALALAAADVDADGDADLLVTNLLADTLSVLLNVGNATFAPAIEVDAGNAPTALAAGDFDGDNHVDVAVANLGLAAVTVLTGDGAGGFGANIVPAGGLPAAIAAADVDGDGDLDLALASRSTAAVAVLFNPGDGRFEAPVVFDVGGGPTAISAADLDGPLDGDDSIDLLIADRAASAVAVLDNAPGRHVLASRSGAAATGFDFGNFTALAELTPTVAVLAMPAPAVPGDRAVVRVTVRNTGNALVRGRMDIDLHASTDAMLDGGDTLLHHAADVFVNLSPGAAQRFTFAVTLTAALEPGEYRLLADVDAGGAFAELDEANNTVAAPAPFTYVWQFGRVEVANVGVRRGVRLGLDVFTGGAAWFVLGGAGTGQVTLGPQGLDVAVTGATSGTAVIVYAGRGAQGLALHDVTVAGSLRGFFASRFDLIGAFEVTGTLATFIMRDTRSGAAIVIGPAASERDKVVLLLRKVSELSIESQTHIRYLRAVEWLDRDGTADAIAAPAVDVLVITGGADSDGDFEPDLALSGAGGSARTLGVALVRGAVRGGTWRVGAGDVGTLVLGSAEADFAADLAANLITLVVRGDYRAALAAAAVNTVIVRGDVTGGVLLAGARFGADARPGGVGADADTFAPGALRLLSVAGRVTSSVIGAGLDAVDGTLNNGDDVTVGGGASRITTVVVAGPVSDDSLIAGGALPLRVFVNRKAVDPAADRRFLQS